MTYLWIQYWHLYLYVDLNWYLYLYLYVALGTCVIDTFVNCHQKHIIQLRCNCC